MCGHRFPAIGASARVVKAMIMQIKVARLRWSAVAGSIEGDDSMPAISVMEIAVWLCFGSALIICIHGAHRIHLRLGSVAHRTVLAR